MRSNALNRDFRLCDVDKSLNVFAVVVPVSGFVLGFHWHVL